MKQPNFKRKALGMLMVPLALGALPLNAAPLNIEQYYNGYSEFWHGTDAEGNTLVFYITDNDECRLVNIETSNGTVTVPESVNVPYEEYVSNPETGDEEYVTSYKEIPVTKFQINNDEWYWIFNPLSNADSLTDIILPSNITDFTYRQPDYHKPVNIHFTSDNVPAAINVEGWTVGYNGWMTSRCPISVPATFLESYKEAFSDFAHCSMIIEEGTDPKEVYAAELSAIDGISVTEDPDCVPYASWSGTDDNGTLYAFEYPWYDDVTFRGTITKEKSISIPKYVYVAEPEWYTYMAHPVTRFCLDYYNEDNNGFPGSSNLKDIYVPSQLWYAEFHGEGFDSRMDFHFTSQEVPEFHFYDGSSNYVNIYVPEELFLAYGDALSDYDYVLWSESPATPVNINVATPGTLAEQIAAVIEDLRSVRWLVVTGTPDEIDLRMIRRLPRLEKLDLSATTGLTSVGGCNGLRHLMEVQLPEGITSIDNSAFQGCVRLSDINFPEGLTSIGDHAFYDCWHLKNIQLPKTVTRIDSWAFEYAGVTSANLENVEFLGTSAFRACKLTEVSLNSASQIYDHAFESCRLEKVSFGPNVSNIGEYAFNDNRLSGTIEIPKKVTEVGWGIFENNPEVTKFIIHNKVNYIHNNSFRSSNSKLESIECNMLFPTDYNGCHDMDLSKVTLYVPALTINEYLLHDNWLNFTKVEPLPNDLKELDIDREFILSSNKGIADKANLNLIESVRSNNERGHLTVNRSQDLNLGNFNMTAYSDREYWDDYYGWRHEDYTTIIPESNVTAENITLDLRLRTDRWTFLSFPFDVNVKDIVVDEDAPWVVRKYSGEARANLEENTWQNMTDETVLKAGEGYIFNCAAEGRSDVSFKIRPAAEGNALFANKTIEKTLASYPSEFAHNASWNLAGNTFPAFFNLKGVEFDAPITIWRDGTYYAYSTIDDDLVLEPFQAFFVQALAEEGGDLLKLNPAARAHSREAAAELEFVPVASRVPRAGAIRSLFNVSVKGENGADRTRIVVNEEASAAYEANRDASKFMSSDELVPQIFVNNSNVRMAINEAPLGNGEFTIGTRFGKKGEYTISLDTRNAEAYSALLIDNVTGETTDLTVADYVFEADAAFNDSRFTLALTSTNAVDAVAAEGLEINVDGNVLSIRSSEAVEINVAAIDGKTVASDFSADFSATLESGIYIVKAGQKTVKVKVGK